MTRKTKQQKQEIKEFFYGINRNTLEIEMVSLNGDNVLSRLNSDGVSTPHAVLFGRNPAHEVTLVFHLVEVFSVPAFMNDSNSKDFQLEKLKEKAAEMKAKKKDADEGES